MCYSSDFLLAKLSLFPLTLNHNYGVEKEVVTFFFFFLVFDLQLG